jgi:DNA helicase-2/ATP-dependent DNA helicase PcrA
MPSTQHKPSEQQQAVLDWVKNGEGNLNLKAYAGTGKTSTLMMIAMAIKGMGDGFLGAFNKAIAEEFKERLAQQGSYWVKGATIHSAGYSAWTKVTKGLGSPDSYKVKKLAQQVCAWDRKLQTAIKDTVGYAKQECLGVVGCDPYTATEPWQRIIEYYDMREEIRGIPPEQFISMCQDVYKRSLDLCKTVIDFDDMILAPLYYRAPFKKYDWVMIDEAQDTNTGRRLIAYESMKADSRLIVVGDPYQSIYGFAGATNNAMDLIKEQMHSEELSLSVTYRCPKSVVSVAQNWVPDFTAAPNAPQGLVTNLDHTDFWRQSFSFNDAILCRNTRPLVGIAGRLRDKGIQCVVEGQSGKALVALAIKWGEDLDLGTFLDKLREYERTEVSKWMQKGQGERAETIQDRCGTLRDLCKKLGKGGRKALTEDLAKKIEFLFGDAPGVNTLRLCTVHRSKGREWNRVYLIGRNRYMPSVWAKKDWEQQQETNLMYVAVTRAKVELVEVEVPFKRKGYDTEWWEEGWRASYEEDDLYDEDQDQRWDHQNEEAGV